MSGFNGDLRFELRENQYYDFTVVDRDVDQDDGLETAILISLFTDSRINNDAELPDSSGYKGGFWGDSIKGDSTGSLLWTLQRAKINNDTLARAKEYCKNALNWMIIDSIAQNIEVTITRSVENFVLINISIERPSNDSISFRYFYNWQNQIVKRG